LQTYNKIIGPIGSHFGKQTNKETKLRIHNITAKTALKYGNEAWVLKKKETTFRSSTDEIFEALIHSFRILSDDRSKASSKTMPSHSAI